MPYSSSDTASVASTSAKIKDPIKKLWCQTQWTNLSHQARNLKMDDIYFDYETMLLDKEQNRRLWKLLNRLYDVLGPDKAPYACPIMQDGGKVEWHNYEGNCRGLIVEVVENE